MDKKKTIYLYFLIAVAFSVLGCSCKTPPSKDLQDYVKVKQDYIAALEKMNPEWGKQYHLAAVPPFAEIYMPGTPLMKDSFEPLTDSCLVPKKDMPPKEVADPPTSTAKRTFNTKAGLPSLLKEAVKQIADLNASVGQSKEAQFSYSDLSVMNPRRDSLESALRNTKCLNVIAGKNIILIRGLIKGKETIFSASTFSADANVKVLTDNAITVKYDSSGGYEVKDARERGRFWIVGEWRIDIPGLTESMSAADRKARIEDFLRMEFTKTPLSVKETEPTSKTIETLENMTSGAR